jgi:hypothetical protein
MRCRHGGEAYLVLGNGPAAAAEFQKILDHSRIVPELVRQERWRISGADARTHSRRAPAPGTHSNAAHNRALTDYRDFFVERRRIPTSPS